MCSCQMIPYEIAPPNLAELRESPGKIRLSPKNRVPFLDMSVVTPSSRQSTKHIDRNSDYLSNMDDRVYYKLSEADRCQKKP